MINVIINNKNMYDYGLVLADKTVGYPEPKTHKIDIPGMDGVLDVTEAIGAVKVGNRNLSFTFYVPNRSTFWSTVDVVVKEYHGKKCSIEITDNPGWIYSGRVTIGVDTSDKVYKLTMAVDAQPYKTNTEGEKCI